MWPIILAIVIFAVACGGLIAIIVVARKSTTTPATPTPAPTPAPTPTPSPATTWWSTRTANEKDGIKITVAVIAVIIIAFGLMPGSWRSFLFFNKSFWVIAIAFTLYGFVESVLFPSMEKGKKLTRSLAGLALLVVIVGQVWCWVGTPNLSAQEFLAGTKSFFSRRPGPEPEPKWKGEKIVEAPVNVSWDKIPAVETPWLIAQWRLDTLMPNPTGRYEIMAKGWDKPFTGGGSGKFTLPSLPADRKIKIRSIEKEPLTLRMQWR